MSTLFLTNELELGTQSQNVISCVQNVTETATGDLTLAEGEQVSFQAPVWCLFSLKVVGAVDVTVDSTDWDDLTPITGTVGSYGIAKYPGTYSIVTKPATITLTGGVGGAILGYLIAYLIDDTQL